MSWAAPVALGWAGLALAVLGFFLLRPRRQRIVVASLLVWRRTLAARADHTWLSWLRRHAGLLAQLLAVVVFALALARPERQVSVDPGPPVALVIDVSASMAMTDDAGVSRMDEARGRAAAFLRALEGERRVSVITAGAAPRALAVHAADRGEVERALAAVQPEAAQGRIATALDMARSLAPPAQGGLVALVTDDRSAGAAPAGVRTVLVGAPAPNVALEAFQVRRRLDAQDAVQAVAAVRNQGPAPVAAEVRVTAGNTALPGRRVELAAGERQTLVFDDLPPAVGYRAQASAPGDRLAADDAAFAALAEAPPLDVLVVGNEPDPIMRALQALPAVTAHATSIQAFDDQAPGRADVYVFQGFAPAALPAASTVLVRPPQVPSLEIEAPRAAGELPRAAAESPLLRAIDAADLASDDDFVYALPPWAAADLGVGGQAVLAHGVANGRRTALIGFQVTGARASQAPWYPLFWSNVMQWANPANPLPEGAAVQAGWPLPLVPHPRADRVVVTAPGGDSTDYAAPRGAVLRVSAPGAYTVRQFAGGELIVQTSIDFAPDPGQARRVPPQAAALAAAGGGGAPPMERRGDLWPWLAALALLLLLAEWWLSHRVRGVR